MRPKTKVDAKRLTLTLSGPARAFLMRMASKKQVSQTQVVELLIEASEASEKTVVFVPAVAVPPGKQKPRGKRSCG